MLNLKFQLEISRGRGKKKIVKKYEIRRHDPLNFVIIEFYISQAKVSKGKEMEKGKGYFSNLSSALEYLAKMGIEEAAVEGMKLQDAIKNMQDFYKKSNKI